MLAVLLSFFLRRLFIRSRIRVLTPEGPHVCSCSSNGKGYNGDVKIGLMGMTLCTKGSPLENRKILAEQNACRIVPVKNMPGQTSSVSWYILSSSADFCLEGLSGWAFKKEWASRGIQGSQGRL